MQRISILQIGGGDFNSVYQVPWNFRLIACEEVKMESGDSYDIVIINRDINENDYRLLVNICKPYHVFATDKVKDSHYMKLLMDKMVVQRLESGEEIQEFLTYKAKYYFNNTIVKILNPLELEISKNYQGIVSYAGGHSVTLNGDYGEKKQIAVYRTLLPVEEESAYDIWFEYEKDESVSLSLVVVLFSDDAISEIAARWEFTEKDMEKIVTIQNEKGQGHFFFSINASGNGMLKIRDVHYRLSRRNIGNFIPGDCRIVTKNREEVFYYYEPGNAKAPLNVLFSDFNAENGFDGVEKMRSLGHPFLVFSDRRLGGGAFYIGDHEYERKIKNIINDKMKELSFSKEEVILSGISMGAYGAMYYACGIEPHGVILGRPLLSIGEIAKNERLIRPGVWPYPMDVVISLMGDLSDESLEKMDEYLWSKYRNKQFGKTKFAVAYMLEDDFDQTAYQKMLDNIGGRDAFIYGKGIHGRHTDEKKSVRNWFSNQFSRMIQEDF